MLSKIDRRPARRRGPGPAAVLAAGLAAGLVLAAAGCTTSPGAADPDAGMSAMAGPGDKPGMGDVTSAPITPALAAAAPAGTGLSSSLHGYTFVPSTLTAAAGSSSAYSFRITGPDGRAVTRYQPYESAFVICYVIGSDLSEYDYLQPAMREDGTWTAALPALPAGSYRTFVTFAAPDSSQGTPLVYQLSSPLTVPGRAAAAATPVPVLSASADGYTVSLAGDPRAGVSGPLKVVVAKGGKPVESFQRFLDAYVHLTAFHAGDLAFAQILSLGGVQPGTGAMTAEALFPESGVWRVFAQFDLDGSVHTIPLALNVP